MAPSPESIELTLRQIIQTAIDDGDEDQLTVRYVRDKGVEELKLDQDFFTTSEWKDRSKAFIKTTAGELIDAKEHPVQSIEIKPKPAKKQVGPIQKAPKRVAQAEKVRPTKRQRKEETPSAEEEDEESEAELSESSEAEESSAVSEFDDSDISDAPRPKKKTKSIPASKRNAPAKGQAKRRKVESSDEEETADSASDMESDAASTPPRKNRALNRRKSKEALGDSDLDSEDEKPAKKKAAGGKKVQSKERIVESESDAALEEEKASSKTKNKRVDLEAGSEDWKATKEMMTAKPKTEVCEDDEDKPNTGADTKANDSDSSEMSVVLDEPPKPKKRGPIPSTSNSSKPKIKTSTKEKDPSKDLTPNEAQIKALQGQLVKCGVRKIWAFELKRYNDDEKAKISHLQGMLRDIGMTGRFSDQRAKEIKELRELQADLEAVKEGEKSWGMESGRRSRGVRKSLKESSPEDEEEDGDGDGDGARSEGGGAGERSSKAARAKQELAFLGDEDEDSDSDD